MAEQACARCGSQESEEGSLKARHLFAFRPKRARFLALSMSVRLTARMCRSCGPVELRGDPRKLRDMTRR